jgi:hypothetical protein
MAEIEVLGMRGDQTAVIGECVEPAAIRESREKRLGRMVG